MVEKVKPMMKIGKIQRKNTSKSFIEYLVEQTEIVKSKKVNNKVRR